jgi:H/ACA ribonucleoprotein complex subunit 4
MDLPIKKDKKVIVRKEAKTDSNYGKKPSDRTLDELLSYGYVILNKSPGPTSHQVTDFVKSILGVDKAGHSGSLDPNVTGVLVITLGKVTRVVDSLLKSGKEYVCLMRLHEDIEEKKIRETLQNFVGEIQQLPPRKSAVKRQIRTREIYYIEIIEIKGRDVLFRVGCQAGTYIRKLCTDAGEEMGTKGHMQELVRTKVAHFTQEEWKTLHDIKDAYTLWKEEGNEEEIRKCVRPIEDVVEYTSKIWVADSAVDALCHGAFLSVPGVIKCHDDINVGDKIALMTLKEELIGLGKARMNTQNILRQEKGMVVGELKIFMKRGTYPKFKH